jgi:glyoxylase-like metal-dependent hydrolase (beta-lactamase superfamily II)
VRDGDRFPLGDQVVQALHTPGHSPGHTCYLFAGRLLTGDLLFCGKVGGTGPFFPGSSAGAEWKSLHRLLTLPEETLVFPGHDYFGGEGEMPHSTIGYEKVHNPFLLCADFEAFCELKENWLAYKEKHGIR